MKELYIAEKENIIKQKKGLPKPKKIKIVPKSLSTKKLLKEVQESGVKISENNLVLDPEIITPNSENSTFNVREVSNLIEDLNMCKNLFVESQSHLQAALSSINKGLEVSKYVT